jgi:hypothetical protein
MKYVELGTVLFGQVERMEESNIGILGKIRTE